MTPMRAIGRLSAVLGLVTFVAACELFSDPTPDSTRVFIEGVAGARVRVITSSNFVAGVNNAGTTRVEILQSDTAVATLPFERRYQIGGDYQFFVEASRLDADVPTFRMQVYVDDNRRFDQRGALIPDAPYRFVYQFNRFFTDAIQVVF